MKPGAKPTIIPPNFVNEPCHADQRKLPETHHRADSDEPELCNLVCNTGRLSTCTTAELIVVVLRKRID